MSSDKAKLKPILDNNSGKYSFEIQSNSIADVNVNTEIDDLISSDDELDSLLEDLIVADQDFTADSDLEEPAASDKYKYSSPKSDVSKTDSTKHKKQYTKATKLTVKTKPSVFQKLKSSFIHTNSIDDKYGLVENKDNSHIGKELLEAEKLEQEKSQKERFIVAKAEKAHIEVEHLVAEKLEKERLEQEKIEAKKIATENSEKAGIEAKREEVERLQKEKLKQERLKEARLIAEKLGKERLEKAEKERIEAEDSEKEKLEQEIIEKLRLAFEKVEKEHPEVKRLETERIVTENAEKECLKYEYLKTKKIAQKKLQDELKKEQREREALKQESEKAQIKKEKILQLKQIQQRLKQDKQDKQDKQESIELKHEALLKELSEADSIKSKKIKWVKNFLTRKLASNFKSKIIEVDESIVKSEFIDAGNSDQNIARELEVDKQVIQLYGDIDDKEYIENKVTTSYDPENYMLAEFLHNLELVKQSLNVIRLKFNRIILVIDVRLNTVYCNFPLQSKAFIEFCNTPVGQLKTDIKTLSYEEAQSHKTLRREKNELSHPLKEFIWISSLLVAQGRLPINTDLTVFIGIKNDIDTCSLEQIPHLEEIIAKLSNDSYSLMEISERLDIPHRYIVSFYNVALNLDLLEFKVKKKIDAKKVFTGIFTKKS